MWINVWKRCAKGVDTKNMKLLITEKQREIISKAMSRFFDIIVTALIAALIAFLQSILTEMTQTMQTATQPELASAWGLILATLKTAVRRG